ncbi:MAG: helix-turn-helix domain-containing protein [Candidatus Omnitrophica bacterium]|nr:helix-turn-helix domain-containing protein [Candidatus Omnitrophota bacterium]
MVSKKIRKAGEEIREFRLKFRITQDALAEKIGINPRSIRWWESGKINPHPIFWERFVKIKNSYERRMANKEVKVVSTKRKGGN